MLEKLKDLRSSQEICSVYNDGNETTKFSVGFIVDYDAKFFLMEQITPYGKNDGIQCNLVDFIIKIETASGYIKKIEKLYSFNKQKRRSIIDCKSDVVVALLNFAIKNCRICSIVLCESNNKDIVGYIKNISKDIATIQNVDENGNEDGNTFVELGRISQITCGSEDEEKLEILHKLQHHIK